MKYLIFIFILFVLGCNPIPKKDAHPEVPLLTELLKDTSKFGKVADKKDVSELIFLNDDGLLVMPNNSNLPFKIIDVDKKIIFQHVYDGNLPFYVDKQGNLYLMGRNFFIQITKRNTTLKPLFLQIA